MRIQRLQRLGSLDPSRFDTYMRVNALSALLVTERLLPNVRAGKLKKIAGISARVASFAAYPRIHSGLGYFTYLFRSFRGKVAPGAGYHY